MKQAVTQKLAASVAVLCVIWVGMSVAQGQQASNQLRRTLPSDGNSPATPLTDNNLDGAEDDQANPVGSDREGDEAQPTVIFSTQLPGDSNGETASDRSGSNSNDRRNNGQRTSTGQDGQTSSRLPGALPRSSSQPSQADGEALPVGNRRARRQDVVGTVGPDGNVTPLANTRARLDQGTTRTPEDSPYAALGIRVGTFTLLPVISQTFGTSSNAEFTNGGRGSAFSQTDAQVQFQSNWAVHELRGQISASYQKFFESGISDLPTLNADSSLRLDWSRATTLTLGSSVALSTEAPSTLNFILPPTATLGDRPLLQSYGGFAEFAHVSGRLTTTLRGSVDRSIYDKLVVNGAPDISQSDRNFTLYQARARFAYESSPALQPFIEGNIGTRRFDTRLDRNGQNRDSVLASLRVGAAINRGEKLTGQFGVGYAIERFEDSGIDTLGGLTVDGQIDWSPVRLTTITATASTTLTGSTELGLGGSLTYAGSLAIRRDIRPNFSINGSVLGSIRDFDGGQLDRTIQLQTGAEWSLNRSWALLGQIGYEKVDSTDPANTYDAYTARMTLRFQR